MRGASHGPDEEPAVLEDLPSKRDPFRDPGFQPTSSLGEVSLTEAGSKDTRSVAPDAPSAPSSRDRPMTAVFEVRPLQSGSFVDNDPSDPSGQLARGTKLIS